MSHSRWRRRSFLAGAASAAVGVGGCSALDRPEDDSSGNDTSEDYPPGVTEDGIDAVTRLRSAHREGLTSFRRRQSLEYTVAEGESVVENGRQVMTAASDQAAQRLEYLERGDSIPAPLRAPYTGLWTDGKTSALRRGDGADAEVDVRNRPHDRLPLSATERVGRALGGSHVFGEETTDGGRWIWLRSTGDPHRAQGLEDPSEYEAVAAVGRRGVVEFLLERGLARDGGRQEEVAIRNRFIDVGETTVARPDWAGE